MKGKGSWIGLIILIVVVVVGAFYGENGLRTVEHESRYGKQVEEEYEESEVGNYKILEVHYIDVGQGDATLLVEGNQDTVILVDAGDWKRKDVLDYLGEYGIEKIDLLIGTHPHADHIGQMDKIIEEYEVEEVWMSGDVANTKNFERVITAIDKKEIKYNEPRAWEEYELGNMEIEVVGPELIRGDLNNGSIAFRLKYGEVGFLFTGDAEVKAEREIIERGHDLSANILHLGHHGSDTSTTDELLNLVVPEVAVYSAGENNSYGHPSRATVNKVLDRGIELYGTDKDGTVIIETDGVRFAVYKEK